MSQSPLARSTRRPLPRFGPTASRLSKSTSSQDLADNHRSSSSSPIHDGHTTPSKLFASGLVTPRPQTPKITYSPYATSSPHAGLSKSTSIPFDMAASAKAARKMEQGKGKGVVNAECGDTDPPLPKKRFIRRKPLWER